MMMGKVGYKSIRTPEQIIRYLKYSAIVRDDVDLAAAQLIEQQLAIIEGLQGGTRVDCDAIRRVQ